MTERLGDPDIDKLARTCVAEGEDQTIDLGGFAVGSEDSGGPVSGADTSASSVISSSYLSCLTGSGIWSDISAAGVPVWGE